MCPSASLLPVPNRSTLTSIRPHSNVSSVRFSASLTAMCSLLLVGEMITAGRASLVIARRAICTAGFTPSSCVTRMLTSVCARRRRSMKFSAATVR